MKTVIIRKRKRPEITPEQKETMRRSRKHQVALLGQFTTMLSAFPVHLRIFDRIYWETAQALPEDVDPELFANAILANYGNALTRHWCEGLHKKTIRVEGTSESEGKLGE